MMVKTDLAVSNFQRAISMVIPLSLGLELVHDPGVLEGTLTRLGGLLLELLNGSLVDTTALVDEVTGRGGLAGVDVTDDDEVDVRLFFAHGCLCY
jgi:hypothetical protein